MFYCVANLLPLSTHTQPYTKQYIKHDLNCHDDSNFFNIPIEVSTKILILAFI